MVVHIVMFRFKEENKRENLLLVQKRLIELEEKIDVLKKVEVGCNFSKEQRAMDLSLYTLFEREEDLQKYALHPKHLEVVALIKEVTTESKVVDYHI